MILILIVNFYQLSLMTTSYSSQPSFIKCIVSSSTEKMFECSICNCRIQNYKIHLKSQKHMRNIGQTSEKIPRELTKYNIFFKEQYKILKKNEEESQIKTSSTEKMVHIAALWKQQKEHLTHYFVV
jgi:hypothetical protein